MSNPSISDLKKLAERIDELNAENARLKAQVERLTKAGDAMAEIAQLLRPFETLVKDWENAKEVQS